MGAADYAGVRWPDDGTPVIRRVQADGKAPPRTTARASVFDSGRRRRMVGAPDPQSLRVIDGPPPRVDNCNPPSAWRAVYAAMVPGKGVELTERQARAFCAWARAHKVKLVRRKLEGDRHGVWLRDAAGTTQRDERTTG